MSKTGRRTCTIAARRLGVPVALAVSLSATGCTTVVIPPADPPGAVVVSIVDHGRHAELVLPDGDGGSVAYVYGDWDYFTLGKDDAWHAMLAVALPPQGALGRRRDPRLSPAELGGWYAPGTVLELHVSEEAVASLLERLDARFESGMETYTRNRELDLEFVKDPAAYIWFHNCNVVLAGWLQDLGCDCRGLSWYADFVVG